MLDKKLYRDLIALRGTVITVSLLVAAGVAVMTGSSGTYTTLVQTRDTYYRESHFSDLWYSLIRAPVSLVHDLERIPGVGALENRIIVDVRIDWHDTPDSISGTLISLPALDAPGLDRLSLKNGRWPAPNTTDEVVVNFAFANARKLNPNALIDVILNGRVRHFRVVGSVASPEYIYATQPGNPLPDDTLNVILWADRDTVANSTGMSGAFNTLAVTLAPGALSFDVEAAIDEALQPYGSHGGVTRSTQTSNRFLDDELHEQRVLSLSVPLIFFAVASFLLHVIVGRLIESQREQMATLKALGYPSLSITMHYVSFVAIISVAGSLLGILLGYAYGSAIMVSYRGFFRFPELDFSMPLWAALSALLASIAAGLAGGLDAVLRVLALPAVEVLRPNAPTVRAIGFFPDFIKPTFKIAFRNLIGRPIRTSLTIIGLAMSVPMIVLGLFWWDALDSMIRLQFVDIDRSDAIAVFVKPLKSRVIHEIVELPGVIALEGQRVVDVRLENSHHTYRIGLVGLERDSEFHMVRSASGHPIYLPDNGIVMSSALAQRLGLRLGDELTVNILDGRRPRWITPLIGLVDEALGFTAYVDLAALNRVMGEDDSVSQAAMRIEGNSRDIVRQAIVAKPQILSFNEKSRWIDMFQRRIGNLILVSASVLTFFGLIVAIGVIYNSTRVALQERAWELASLRVLGFTRSEVTTILFSELGIELAMAMLIGRISAPWWISALITSVGNESFSIPLEISPKTYMYALFIVFAAALGSGMVVKQSIDHLDLVRALKTRE